MRQNRSSIYDKWLGVLEPTRVSWEKVRKYAAMILIPLVLLLTSTFVWSRTLQSLEALDDRFGGFGVRSGVYGAVAVRELSAPPSLPAVFVVD